MSQHNSSVMSSGVQNPMQNSMQGSLQNSQAKYQKALKQISKLIATNKNLKNQCEERQQILVAQLSDVAMRFQELSKKYEEVDTEKKQMEGFIEELQDTNEDLRKENQTMERQVGYLNDVLTQQNAQLKKLSVFKNQKGMSELLRSYEERQNSYKKDISRLQENFSNLKDTIDRIESDLAQQTQMRQRYQDQYNIVGLEINKYRDLNNYLMNQNEIILNGVDKDSGYSKHQELQSFVFQFKRQLQTLRNIKYEAQDVSEKQYAKNYEILLDEKNNLAIQLAKTRDQLEITQTRVKEMYDLEQKMSTAVVRSDMLVEQTNMLKNRITILQSKEIIDGAGFDEDSDLKDFQDKINFMMSKADPLLTIKNGDDNTHFITMKSYITDLQVKLQSTIEQKQSAQRKYTNLKIKFSKKAEESIILNDSNKLLKGKLQGYERLTQKLHYQLERSMHAHQDEIVKMVAITNNLVGKKVEQSQSASAFIKSQFDIELEKAERAQKALSQQLQALKLQNSTQRIKISDYEQRLKQSSQFMQIYQTKLNEITARYKQLQQENTSANQNVLKYEQLFRQEKTRYETILIQKQNLANKISVLSEQVNERTYGWQEQLKQKDQNYEGEIKRARLDLIRFKDQTQALKSQNKSLVAQINGRRVKQNAIFDSLKQQNQYYNELQRNYNQLKQVNNSLQNELISLKHKYVNYDHVNKRVSELETQCMRRNDQLNDQKRASLTLRKQIQSLQLSNNDLNEHNLQLSQQITALSAKILKQPAHSSNRDPFSSVKQAQSRRTIQKLHEQIAILQSSVRQQKIKYTRIYGQVQTLRDEIQRLGQVIEKNKSRQQSLVNTITLTQDEVSQIQDELLEYKSKYSHNSNTLQSCNQALQQAHQKISALEQQSALVKSKLGKSESKYETLFRNLTGMRHYVQEAEKMVKRLRSVQKLQWDQQRQKDNLSSLVDSLKRIFKMGDSLQLSNSGSNQQYSFVPSSSFGNLQENYSNGRGSLQNGKINFSGSFGNDVNSRNVVTNDTFRGYQGSSNFESTANVNYSSDYLNQVY